MTMPDQQVDYRQIDRGLVLRAREGDERSFATLTDRYRGLVYSTLQDRLTDYRDI